MWIKCVRTHTDANIRGNGLNDDNWAGWVVQHPDSSIWDVSSYDVLSFWIMVSGEGWSNKVENPNLDLRIEVEDQIHSSKFHLTVPDPEVWTKFTIRKDQLQDVDFTNVTSPFKIFADGGNLTFSVDQVRWEKLPAADAGVGNLACPTPDVRPAADQGMIIDNFETSRNDNSDICLLNLPASANPNLLGDCSKCFNNCGANCPTSTAGNIETSLTTATQDALWCSGHSTILSYDVSNTAGGTDRSDRFAGYVQHLAGNDICGACIPECGGSDAADCRGLDVDALNFKNLTFWLKFDSNNQDVEVALKDVCGHQTASKLLAIEGGYTGVRWGSWTKVTMPISKLTLDSVDSHELQEISFMFAQEQPLGTSYALTGKMYLDDIAFER